MKGALLFTAAMALFVDDFKQLFEMVPLRGWRGTAPPQPASAPVPPLPPLPPAPPVPAAPLADGEAHAIATAAAERFLRLRERVAGRLSGMGEPTLLPLQTPPLSDAPVQAAARAALGVEAVQARARRGAGEPRAALVSRTR